MLRGSVHGKTKQPTPEHPPHDRHLSIILKYGNAVRCQGGREGLPVEYGTLDIMNENEGRAGGGGG